MAGYIGPTKDLTSDIEQRSYYLASAGQTVFAGTYTVGYVDVYKNGLKLRAITEFTATNGTSITLTSAAALNDKIDIIGRITSKAYDFYLKSQVDVKIPAYGAATGSGNAMALSTSPVIPSLVDGQEIRVRVPSANTVTTPSITLTQLGVSKTITKLGNQPLKAGDLLANQEITIRYNSVTDKMELITAVAVAAPTDKIQVFTATATTGILTGVSGATTLDFRSPTLSSGAVNTLDVASLSLAIPSAASMGVSTGTSGRLIWLIAYNAGVPVLCVANILSEIGFHETTLISPTTISAGATSIGIIYSASAVAANSPYRVIGFSDAVFTTGTGWSNPTSVRGKGGQGFVMVGNLGYNQTWQAVSRAMGTVYTNSTSKPITVMVNITYNANTSSAVLYLNGVAMLTSNGSTTGGYITIPMTFIVPPGSTYRIVSAYTGDWSELR